MNTCGQITKNYGKYKNNGSKRVVTNPVRSTNVVKNYCISSRCKLMKSSSEVKQSDTLCIPDLE